MKAELITTPEIEIDHADLYVLLGISEDATQEEIRNAYKKLVSKHHPDRDGDQEIFKSVKQAYEVLIDPVKRQNYDATGIFEGEDIKKMEIARSIIEKLINLIIRDPNIDLEYVDIVSEVKENLFKDIKTHEKTIKQTEHLLKRFYKYKNRAKSGIILSVFNKNITEFEDALTVLIRGKNVCELAIKIVENCVYEFGEVPNMEEKFHVENLRWFGANNTD